MLVIREQLGKIKGTRGSGYVKMHNVMCELKLGSELFHNKTSRTDKDGVLPVPQSTFTFYVFTLI